MYSPSHNYDCFKGSYLILRYWKGWPWSPDRPNDATISYM